MTPEQFSALINQIKLGFGCIAVILVCFLLTVVWHVRRHWDD